MFSYRYPTSAVPLKKDAVIEKAPEKTADVYEAEMELAKIANRKNAARFLVVSVMDTVRSKICADLIGKLRAALKNELPPKKPPAEKTPPTHTSSMK